jgi:hypothetical protein
VKFIPSLELSRMLFEEQIQPFLAHKVPDLAYAAATSGMCSEILGLDDRVSMDHEWGPRLTLFLAGEDHERYAAELVTALRESLPDRFHGLDMMWRKPGVDLHDTKERALYHVGVTTVDRALRFCGGAAALPLRDVDWLRVSEQHLLEFTAGVVYRDDRGELTRARELLGYYPDHVLRFLLMGEWNAVGGDWFPIGRIGSRGDKLGLRIQAAQVAQHLMRIAFMVSRTYFPYKKWFGTMFKRLPLAEVLEPILLAMLQEEGWQDVEERIGEAADLLLRAQNRLGIAPPITLSAQTVDDGRHHVECSFWEIGRQTGQDVGPALQALIDNQVGWRDGRNLILWDLEGGKWSVLLQKPS